MWVVFDLGGVLFRIRNNWYDAAKYVGIDRPDFKESIFSSPQFRSYQLGDIDDAEYAEVLGSVLDVNAAEALAIHDAILDGPYPGTLDLVNELNERGYKTACLSNTNALHWAKLINADYFPAMAALHFQGASHLLRLEKPSLEIFRAFERETASSGDQIIFFDDIQTNVEGAIAAGWKSHQVPTDDPVSAMRKHLIDHGYLVG